MNWKVFSAIIAIVVVGASVGCESNDFQKSEDGYEYKYIRQGDGETPKSGEVVRYNMSYMNEKDSVLFSSTGWQPTMIPCDSAQWSSLGALYNAFANIKEGDSILVRIPTKQVFAESFRAPVPSFLDPEGTLTFCIGSVKNMNEAEARQVSMELQQRAQQEAIAASAEQMEADIETIEAHLQENNITAQSTESGLRFVIESEGTGNYPQPGQTVYVHYTGTLLDGTKFDASFDHNPPEPLDFPIGQGQVIQGWDEGIALLKKGGKATLYIPSPLGYGARAMGQVIKANSILKFEVELVDIVEL